MPLDLIINNDNDNTGIIDDVPTNIDFDIVYEPTKVADKRYVVNADTGDYIGIVGSKFNTASHGDFFRKVQGLITENLSQSDLIDAKASWRTAHSGGWAMLDITLPSVTTKITTPKHETEVAQRIIALHGIDGSCSNQVYFGAIDFFCTNGMIHGEYNNLRRKNTTNFTIDRFIDELRTARTDFYMQSERLREWANKPLVGVDMQEWMKTLLKSERKADKMFQLYRDEVSVRGENVFALYSAFTNYASYADERNGFKMRETANDTNAVTMWKREHEVSKWTSSNEFTQLLAA